ncbi:HD domain-containing phosphohydrolase [Vibrio sp. VPAP30]|uniref:HD domain-containing phosphohydrolase n=1 Tax=Vibrio sp. VPAP30 TaxID=1647102 RepID=UPI00065A1CB8|nr:HD domain-containing phosphohydrolase [Vibrio sp. VPAP30]KLN65444.1 response regulator [Vibrio sp. VPAP30]
MPDREQRRLLVVDDEVQITKSLSRLLRKEYEVVTFNSPLEALVYLGDNEVAIIMSDMRMPGMGGARFLSESILIQPHAIRIAFSGGVDYRTLVSAINEGKIHHVIAKPWDTEDLKVLLSQMATQYQMNIGLKQHAHKLEQENSAYSEQNSQLLASSTQAQTQLAELKQQHDLLLHRYQTFSQDLSNVLLAAAIAQSWYQQCDIDRVANHAKQLAVYLGVSPRVAERVYRCALLHPIGLVFSSGNEIPDNFANHHLSPCCFGSLAYETLSDSDLLKDVVMGIRHQDENLNGTGYPMHLKQQDIPLTAKIVRVVKDYDYLTVTHVDPAKRSSPMQAAEKLQELAEVHYDPAILKAYLKMVSEKRQNSDNSMEYSVPLRELRVGDEIKRDVRLTNGQVLIKRGSILNGDMLQRLIGLEKQNKRHFAYVV